jgi:hypothetical protein
LTCKTLKRFPPARKKYGEGGQSGSVFVQPVTAPVPFFSLFFPAITESPPTASLSLVLSPFIPFHHQPPSLCFTHPITVRPLSALPSLSPLFPLSLPLLCPLCRPCELRPRCCPSLSPPVFVVVLLEASFVRAFVDCISAFPESASRRVRYPFTSHPISTCVHLPCLFSFLSRVFSI